MSAPAHPRAVPRRPLALLASRAPHRSRHRRRQAVIVALGIGLMAACILAATRGQLYVSPTEVVGSFFHRLGLDTGPMPTHPRGDAALWNVRFPRVALAVLVGAALGGSGAVLQGILGNPLAEPSVIGVSAGTAVGACAVIVFGWHFLGAFTTPAVAFATGVSTTFIVYFMSRHQGRTEVVTLILMGIAINAVASAAIAYMVFLGDTQAREQIVFWQLGSLNGATWDAVQVVAPIVGVGVAALLYVSAQLDPLSLGEAGARNSGVNVERVRVISFFAVAALVAAAVSFAGIIAFVGLVTPHVIRLLIGPAHRALVPASIIGGAIVIVGADLVARTAIEYADLPIGILTALIGGPVFVWMLTRTRSGAGGWR